MNGMSDQPILVTGAAGFIGFHVAQRLLEAGRRVVGLDNLNNYYDPALKQARLDILDDCPGFSFQRLDLADRTAIQAPSSTPSRARSSGLTCSAPSGSLRRQAGSRTI